MASQPLQLWTIGHSTQSMADFQDVLHQASIEVLVDVRRFPASRKFPHFHQDNLSRSLDQVGIRYHWLEGLGGRRSSSPTTADNNAWENKSFRNYADYMQTGEFLAACEELKRIAATGRTAIMCSESVYWRCHRRLISDYFTALGGRVEHLFPDGRTQPHSLTKIAQVHDTAPISITYPG